MPTAARPGAGAGGTAAGAGCSAKPFALSQDARTGTVGVYADSTSVATKTNTPLINIPQSLSVLTKDFIRDRVSRISPT